MLTLLGSLLGFAGSAVPQVIDFFKNKEEAKKNIELIKLEIMAKQRGVELDIKLLQAKQEYEEQQRLIEHDIALGQQGGFINALRAFVRPFITYVFFITFIGVKIVLVYSVLQTGGDMKEAVMVAWDDETEALFAAVMSFWFGSRAMPRLKARNT
jgi:hypothetical protein